MRLADKLKESRLKFNESAREYLGNWVTRDAEFIVDYSLLFAGTYIGITLFPDIVTMSQPSSEIIIGAGIGAALAESLNLFLHKSKINRLKRNLSPYMRLVGEVNAINHGPYEIRKIVRTRLNFDYNNP